MSAPDAVPKSMWPQERLDSESDPAWMVAKPRTLEEIRQRASAECEKYGHFWSGIVLDTGTVVRLICSNCSTDSGLRPVDSDAVELLTELAEGDCDCEASEERNFLCRMHRATTILDRMEREG